MARPAADRLALLAVLLLGTALAVVTARPTVPPFLPIGDYRPYTADSAPATVALEAVLHAPWFGAPRLPLAMVAAAAILAVLWLAARRHGAGPWLAAAVALAFAARPDLGVPTALGAPPLLAVALVWLALAAISPRAPQAAPGPARRDGAAITIAALAAASALWPPIVIVAPLLAGRAFDAWRWRGWLAVTAAAMLGAVAGLAGWSRLAATMSGAAVRVSDLPPLLAGASANTAYPWPPLAVALLPVMLAVVGVVSQVAPQSARSRLEVIAAGARRWPLPWGLLGGAAITLAAAALLPAWRAESSRAILWTLWPSSAAGIVWTVSLVAPRWRRLATAALASLLVVTGGLARLRQTDLVEPTLFASNFATALRALDGPATFVAEDPRLDTALVAWGGETVRRLLPRPDLVAAAIAGDAFVYAGPAGRATLEMHGMRFRPGPAVRTPAPFAWARAVGTFQCLDIGARWSELSGVEYTGRLGLHVPAGAGRLELVVAGADISGVRLATADGRRIGSIVSGPARDLDDLPPVLWPGDGRLPSPDTIATRVTVPASLDYAIDEALALGARAPLVAVRMVGAATRARICAAPLPRFDPFDVATTPRVLVPLADAAYFGSGVYPPEGREADAFRWTGATAVMLLPSSQARAVTVEIEARPAVASSAVPVMLTAILNGVALGSQAMATTTAPYRWTASPQVWVDGTNELTLTVSRTAAPAADGGDPRTLGLALHALRLTRQ